MADDEIGTHWHGVGVEAGTRENSDPRTSEFGDAFERPSFGEGIAESRRCSLTNVKR